MMPVGSALAQSDASVQITAEAEPMRVEPGQPVVFSVRVEGPSATVVQPPDPPSVTNLRLQRRTPSTQRGLSSGGGPSEHHVTFTWRYRALQTGVARIQPVEVTVLGDTYTTEEIQVQVVSEASRSADRSGASSSAGRDKNSALDPQDLFIRATPTVDRMYQNEQVVVKYHLLYRPKIRLRHSRLAGAWSAPGFWREELDVPSRPVPQRSRIDSRTYRSIVLKRVALFPTHAGSLRVDPLRIEVEAQGTLQMQGDAVRGRFEPVELASGALSLSVRSLPPAAPPSFDGAVGQFSMSTDADRDSVAVGSPVEVAVQVQGIGNLATLSSPGLDVPSEFEVYGPSVQTDIDRGGKQIGGTKTFTYTLVPRSSGRYSLSPIRFSYFDPDAEQYRTVRNALPTLRVTGEAAPRVVGRTGDGLPVGDIAGLAAAEQAQWVRADRPPLHRWPWAYVALLLPVLAAGGGAAYRRWGGASETADTADPNASRVPTQDHVHTARQHLRNGDETAFYDTVEQALLTLLDERLQADSAGTTRAALEQSLARHDVPKDLRDALSDLLDRCEEARFAPNRASPDPAEAVLEEAQSVLRRLDERLPEAPGRRPRS